MKRFVMNRYRYYLAVQFCVMVLVILNFRIIEPKQTAALIAGALFIFSALSIAYYEFKHGWGVRSVSFWGTVLFLLGFAFPILLLRLTHWGVEFDQIEWMGLRAQMLHELSNKAFIVMLVTYVIDSVRANAKKSSEASASPM